ncbi:MAG TPA: hypothetical protein PLG93_02540 [bacterium]|nr:hypothetical protein [bacterium]HOR57530.1 hypothetical protein [bacterium]
MLQGGILNDRQRAMLGIVAVFALAGVATLSLFFANTDVVVVADAPSVIAPRQPLRCPHTPEVNGADFNLRLTRDEISLENIAPSPLTNLRVAFYDVLNPSVKSEEGELAQPLVTKNGYVFTIKLGENSGRITRNLPYTFIKNGNNPCVKVEVSTDGVAYHNAVASLPLNN